MSTVIAKNVQIGTSGTSTDNFTIFQPATPDGTLRIGNGNTGITTSQVALTSAGNVGIGTSAPSAKLDVSSANNIIKSTGSSGYAAFYANAATGNAAYNFFGVNGTETARIYSDSANYLAFSTGSAATEQMRLNSTGMGIGTATPSFKLDVSGTGRFTGLTQFDNAINLKTATLNYVYFDDALAFSRNGTGERMRLDSSGNLQFNSGYGSVATAYGCRAWVNFNGQGTVAIRASGNVSSITDNGTGNYTVNFTNAMPDVNYAGLGSVGVGGYNGATLVTSADDVNRGTQSTTAFQIRVWVSGGSTGSGVYDMAYVQMAFFR